VSRRGVEFGTRMNFPNKQGVGDGGQSWRSLLAGKKRRGKKGGGISSLFVPTSAESLRCGIRVWGVKCDGYAILSRRLSSLIGRNEAAYFSCYSPEGGKGLGREPEEERDPRRP